MLSNSCDDWDDEGSSEFSSFEFPYELMPKRRKLAKPCSKKQAVAKSISLNLNTISEEDGDSITFMFTNAPRTFVCEHRGKTPKKSHKGSSPIAERKPKEQPELALSLSRYEGLKAEDVLEQPDITGHGTPGLSPFLEELSSQSKTLQSDVARFDSDLQRKQQEWDLLRRECLSFMKDVNVCDFNDSLRFEQDQDVVKKSLSFLQSTTTCTPIFALPSSMTLPILSEH